MFETDRTLMSIILENLTEDGMSISALSRILSAKGIRIHRLELSGYLKALSDMGVIRERDIKPAKVFSITQVQKKTLYQKIGDIISREESDEDKRANLALYVMNRLFRRAIFEKELRMTGIAGTPNARKANEKERDEAAKVLSKVGIKTQTSDHALVSNANLAQAYNKVIAAMLVELSGLRPYLSDTKQKTLIED
ncbi:MAG: hypothetical protein QW505_01310 [Thermoplasmata archaeon]